MKGSALGSIAAGSETAPASHISCDVTAASTSDSRYERLYSLDVLRGVAIALVLIRHVPPSVQTDGEPLGWLIQIGWIGVDLFFVLSGFLISTIIFREVALTGKFDARRFWLRRGLKIWPAYVVAYGGMAIAQVGLASVVGDWKRAGEIVLDAGVNLMFLQNYARDSAWSHSWSLAVEEHFYTFLALTIAVCLAFRSGSARRRMSPIVAWFFCIAVFSLASRYHAAHVLGDWRSAYYETHNRADGLLFGVFVGYFYVFFQAGFQRFVEQFRVILLALGMAFSLIPATLWRIGIDPLAVSVGGSIQWLGFGCLVLLAARYRDFGYRRLPFVSSVGDLLAWLGIYSYTIYLAHSIIFGIPGVETLRQLLLAGLLTMIDDVSVTWVDRMLFWGVSVSLGVLLAKLIERPVLRLRERILPRSRGHTVV